MAKLSAGILLYRSKDKSVEVLLVHPGGPYWAKKDAGAWSVPKGEYPESEDPQEAAVREFGEETGHHLSSEQFIDLGTIKMSSGKTVSAWAVEGDFDTARLVSNTFEIEWPPRSGKMEAFPEADRAVWLSLAKAKIKILKAQTPFLEKLASHLSVEIEVPSQGVDQEPQLSLF